METIGAFLDFIYTFISEGIYTLLKDLTVWFLTKLIIWWWNSATWAIQFAWSIASDVVAELQITDYIIGSIDLLPVTTQQVIAFFNIPEAINMLLSALGTRFVLRFVPFI